MTPDEFSQFARTLPEPMLLVSGSGLVLSVNGATEARLGVAPVQLQGKHLADVVVESRDEVHRYLRLCSRNREFILGALTLRGANGADIACRAEGAALCPRTDGIEAVLLLRLTARASAIGQFAALNQRIRSLDQEVQRRQRAEAEARQAAIENARLLEDSREAARRKDEFLALLAHELRNPLAPLRNGLEILRLAQNGDGDIQRCRGMMERQLGHLVHLVDDLLDVSRITRGTIELRTERIELSTVVSQALEMCQPAIAQQQHQLSVAVPDEPLYVDADRTRLAQALGNLLSNAAKYTESGGRISVTVERRHDDAIISIKDNGIGIPSAMLPRIFDLFTQVDRSLEKSQGGLGVGLTIVRRLVEMHGGVVKAHSDGRGRGSEFVVRLPAADAPIAEERQTDGGRPGGGPRLRRRVLVADDNLDAATTLAMLLKITGHDVRTAHDGIEAVQAAGVFRPDMILLDIGMPGLNGYDACRRIREQPWGQTMLVVAVSGWGQDEDRRRSQEAGFNHHLVKPIEPAALEKLLATLTH